MKKNTIITDPIYQVMNFGSKDSSTRDLLRAVLDTRAFQRLHRISQLGLTSHVFPGATHNRFSHSLGVAFLANRVLAHLYECEGGCPKDHQEERHSVLVAALLHDIGHGPFSHSFEKVLTKLVPSGCYPLHEDWTKLIIQNEQAGICQKLKEYDVNTNQVVSVFDEEVPESDQLAPYLRQIVSSQLNVDRMDYLLRDSHFAGVSIGKIDVSYLINCLTVVNHAENGLSDLGLEDKAIKSYEAFILARQLMNRTVYYPQDRKSSRIYDGRIPSSCNQKLWINK